MSPIRPENKGRYPANWKEIRASILERAKHACEFCAIPNYSTAASGARVVLTIAHLDHTPENNDPSNLRALCQRCHNRYDAPMRAAGRKARRATA
jgi:5-methylcytosine-specific restriction endonuclease McrA